MSGDGVVTVRLPLSLLGAVRATAQEHAISIHEAARRWVSYLPSLSPDDLRALKEPPREFDTPKTSLYLGWRVVDALSAATRNSGLTNSTIIRRLLYAVLVTDDLEFVQQNDRWKLQITRSKKSEKTSFYTAEKGPQCA
jgi:hypothetical protein